MNNPIKNFTIKLLATALTGLYSFAAGDDNEGVLFDDQEHRSSQKHGRRETQDTKSNKTKKQRASRAAFDNLSPEEHLKIGQKFQDDGYYKKAKTHLKKAAEAGIAAAFADLGWIKFLKPNARKNNHNFAKANKYFDQAIALGNIDAKYYKALAHELAKNPKNKLQIETSDEQILQWYKEAADDDHINASYRLGLIYGRLMKTPYVRRLFLKQKRTNEQQTNCLHYLWKAAKAHNREASKKLRKFLTTYSPDNNNTKAMTILSDCYANSVGVAEDQNKAFKYSKIAADSEHLGSIVHVAYCYANGTGVAVDQNEAFKYYKKAADSEHLGAIVHVAYCYANGVGVAVDQNEAFKYAKIAADSEHLGAIVRVAHCYKNGVGVAVDQNEAFKYAKIAADSEHLVAIRQVAHCYAYGVGVAKDQNEAFKYAKIAVQHKDGGMIDFKCIAYCYKNGIGTEINTEEFIKYSILAAQKGDAVSSHFVFIHYYQQENYTMALQYLSWIENKLCQESLPCLANLYFQEKKDLTLAFQTYQKVLNNQAVSQSVQETAKDGLETLFRLCLPTSLKESYNWELFRESHHKHPLTNLLTELYIEHKEELMNYWFESVTLNDPLVFSKLIYPNAQALGLNDNDTLYQEAEARWLSAQESDANPKNPYRVLKSLESKRSETVDWETIAPAHEISGKSGRLNPQAIACLGTNQMIDPDSIPSISYEQLRDALLVIEGKVQNSPALAEWIQTNLTGNELSFNQIKHIAIGDSGYAYLANLLRTNSEHSNYFKCILNATFLTTLSGSSGDLTGVEEQLIRTLMGLRNCGIGQFGSIMDYYLQYIPQKYKLRYQSGAPDVGSTPEAQNAKEVLNDMIKEILELFLNSETAFQRRLCGLPELADDTAESKTRQLSHQVQYLKNLIAPSLGLSKKLQVDPHTQCLYDIILTQSKQDVLKAFYKAMSDNNFFMTELMNRINTAVKNDATGRIYNILHDAVNLDVNQTATGWSIPVVDDEGNITSPQINLEGIFELLVKVGLAEEL